MQISIDAMRKTGGIKKVPSVFFTKWAKGLIAYKMGVWYIST